MRHTTFRSSTRKPRPSLRQNYKINRFILLLGSFKCQHLSKTHYLLTVLQVCLLILFVFSLMFPRNSMPHHCKLAGAEPCLAGLQKKPKHVFYMIHHFFC